MSMRAKFSFSYGAKADQAVVDALNVAGINPPLELTEDGRIQSFNTYECDLEQVLAILPPELRVELQGMADARPFMDLVEAVRALELRLVGRAGEPSSYVNNRVDVHIPGNSLLAIDEVKVEVDFCTESLADDLADGWRIVAVCPQPDQRRPDYVLGRRKPDES